MRKISDFPQYEDSPFAISGLDRRIVVKPGKTATMVSQDGHELKLVESGKSKVLLHDQEQYVKVFRYGVDVIKRLNARAMTMMLMIMSDLQPRKAFVEITRKRAEAFSPKLSGASYYIALVELLDIGVIVRSNNKKIFYINPNVVFNGDRRVMIKNGRHEVEASIQDGGGDGKGGVFCEEEVRLFGSGEDKEEVGEVSEGEGV